MSSNFMQRYPTFRDVGLVISVLHHVTMKSLNSKSGAGPSGTWWCTPVS